MFKAVSIWTEFQLVRLFLHISMILMVFLPVRLI